MTERAFADRMKSPKAGFDVQDPDNIAPAVVWLGSARRSDVTGCDASSSRGGSIMIADGWNSTARASTRARAGDRQTSAPRSQAARAAASHRKRSTALRRTMQFALNDEQLLIRDTRRAHSSTNARVRARCGPSLAAPAGYDARRGSACRAWLGWAGIAIAERYGGSGLGMVELAILAARAGPPSRRIAVLLRPCALPRRLIAELGGDAQA